MTPVATAGTGISIGAVALVGGVIAIVGVAYFLYNKSSEQGKKNTPIKKLLSDSDRYETDKTIILEAIKEKDWNMLEDLLDSSTKDFPDLIKIIKEALKQK